MSEGFFKFPSTPHLVVADEVDVRGDKVLSSEERADFLRRALIVEEKVDGANLGISFSSAGELRAQNRGAYLVLPAGGQWKKLHEWLAPRMDALFDVLEDRWVLFGEWCYARHSVFYDALPDWFLGFDVFDKDAGRFLGVPRRDDALARLEVVAVPKVGGGRFASIADVWAEVADSRLGGCAAEGVYLRFDEGEWLGGRAKVVRGGFVQGIEKHWSRGGLVVNRVVAGR